MIRLRRANLKLKAKKCFLFRQEVEYLGHVVSQRGIKPLASKVAAIAHWAVPTNLEETRSFLGLGHATISNLCLLIASMLPLKSSYPQKHQLFWGAEQQSAFDYLKNALKSPPCLGTIRRLGRLIVLHQVPVRDGKSSLDL